MLVASSTSAVPAELKFTVRSSGPDSGLPLATTVGFWLALTVTLTTVWSNLPNGSVTLSVAVLAPDVVNVWLGSAAVDVPPSLNVQR